MKSDRSVKWADPLSRLRYAPSPTISSAGSEGGATTASSTGEEPVHTQQPDGLASSSSTSGCFRCGSPATSGVLSGQHLLSRRFRCAATEAEYLEWHFSIWGRRTANFAVCVAALVLVNLAIVLAGGSTRRRALDVDDSLYAFGCLVLAPAAGTFFAGASVFLLARTSFYSATVHQLTTVVFLATAFLIDTVPRVVYAESDALEPPEGGLCNITDMELAEVVSLAAGDASAFAYAQCLILGAVTALAGLRPSGCTLVVVFMAYLGHRDQNAMSTLCFGEASPLPDFSSRIAPLVAAVALSFALNDRLRREFVLQQLVRVATVERVKSEQEARDWAHRLEVSVAARGRLSSGGLCPQGPASITSEPSCGAGSSCGTDSEVGAIDAIRQVSIRPEDVRTS